MTAHTAHRITHSCLDETTAFLDDVSRNLRAMRQLYGAHGRRYRLLVQRYQAIADQLGCRQQFDRRLAHPPRLLYRLDRRRRNAFPPVGLRPWCAWARASSAPSAHARRNIL